MARLFAHRSVGSLCFVLTTLTIASQQPAIAQTPGNTEITGVILDVQRHPVTDAYVRLSGAVSETTSTSGDGSFAFSNLPPRVYRLDISKGGFDAATQENIATVAGGTTNVTFTLQAASLTSLTIIGHVTAATRNGANTINTTPAAIVDIPASTFTDQGQLSVNQVLNQQPGITIGPASPTYTVSNVLVSSANGASPLAEGIPSIRGGLPYETESLIDGHAISLGQLGTFSPSFISPYLLQNVEVVKGPGATSPSVNYAINGTVNYRTLEPTVKSQESADFGTDQFGGNFGNVRATGTLSGGPLSYAFDYVTEGTQGFSRGFTPLSVISPIGNIFVNGSQINPNGGFGATPGPSNVFASYNILQSYVFCCPTIPMNSNQHNELGKLRYAFTPSTTLTVTWLGGQTRGAFTSGYVFPTSNLIFNAPAGYTGAIPAGLTPAFWESTYSGWQNIENTNLFETEFHTPIGKTGTLLVRQYSSSIQIFKGGPGDSGPTAAGTTSMTGNIYGGVYFGANNSTIPTIFNGEVVNVVNTDGYSEGRSYNKLNGYTAQIDEQAGAQLLSLSYDQEKTSTLETCEYPIFGLHNIVVPGGSSQTFQSLMGRVQFELGPRLNGTLSDNFGSYTDVYSQDGGMTFKSATHTYQAPRLSLTWRPTPNQSVRAAIGTSIAPPYVALLNNAQGIGPNGIPVKYFTEQGNSGDVLPETAFGFDIGFDTRLHSPFSVLSVDAYQTLLRNQFLTSTTQHGTYTCLAPTSGFYGQSGPLYLTKTANLGHSEYEGIEMSLHRTPPTGWGYRIQGSLQRAFVYDLPAGFFDTPSGPNTTNLAILPNINFQSSGICGYTGMSTARVPYSTGYGEINYRGHNGAYFLAGITYYGPNNAYNEPAFGVVTMSYSQPLTRRSSLQLSVYNVTNAYPSLFSDPLKSRIQTPLVNGQVGQIGANVVGPSLTRLVLHVDL